VRTSCSEECRHEIASVSPGARVGEKPARLDERHGALHPGDRSSSSASFGKSRLAHADSESGLPGRRLDRLVEGRERRVVTITDGHEERDAEGDPEAERNVRRGLARR